MSGDPGSGAAERLRRNAVDEVQRKTTDVEERSPADLNDLIHELEVHQVELEMQNEELSRANRESENARDAYLELYDFAPNGYLTFGERGLILGANLTLASMLGVTRSELLGLPFVYLIADSGGDEFYLWCKRLFAGDEPLSCELRLERKNRPCFWTRLEATVSHDEQGRVVARATVSDITDRKRLESLVEDISQAERASVRRDLHDTVSQHLTGIAFLADDLPAEVANDPESAVASIGTIQQLAAVALEQTQQIARGIDKLPDEPDALFEALIDLAGSLREVFGAPCRITSRTRVDIHDCEIATQLYLIAREAAINAARHSEATRITISLLERGRTVRLTIRDNGRGHTRSTEESNGMGLEIMDARARLIGASLTISPGTNSGTVVECRWRRPEGSDCA